MTNHSMASSSGASPTSTPTLSDPVLVSLATRVADATILSIQKAVAHHANPAQYPIGDEQSLEATFQTFFAQLPADRQQAAVAKAMPLITADAQARHAAYGDLSAIDLHGAGSIFAQVQAMPLPWDVAHLHVQDIAAAVHAIQPATSLPQPGNGGLQPQQAANTLALSVDQIHCDRVTGLLGWANDDIALGGVTIDTVGNVQAIAPFDVGSFGDGDTQGIPHNPFASFPIETQTNWPKAYSVTLVLAEKHAGGVYDFVYQLADKARAYVVQALTTAVGGLIGGIVGSAFPIVGTIIGAVVGAVIGWVIGKVWGWLKNTLFGDDIFTPATMNLSIPSPDALWSGSPNSSPTNWDLRGFHGEYHLNAHWTLSWGAPNVDAIWHKWWDNGWHDWESLGGVANFGAAVASWAPGRLDVFATGTDNQLWHKWFDNNVWYDWEPLGGGLTSPPAAVAAGFNILHIVARGQ